MAFERQYQNNTYIDKGDYFEVYVNNNDLVYKVDSEYVEWMKGYTWYSEGTLEDKHRYLITRVRLSKDKYIFTRYHREIMNREIDCLQTKTENSVIVDHIDGDVYNNLKINLRAVTHLENNINKIMQKNNTTGFVGVGWHKKQKMWKPEIKIKNNSVYLGSYYYLRNALKARIEAEIENFGAYALYNKDYEYKNRVDKILSLPEIPEPIIVSGKKPKSGYRFIYFDKSKNKYFIKINKKYKGFFDTIEEAISDRDRCWREEYGDREMLLIENKIEKMI